MKFTSYERMLLTQIVDIYKDNPAWPPTYWLTRLEQELTEMRRNRNG